MFTGIVTDIGEVLAAEPRADELVRFTIGCRYAAETIDIGASIACSGVCLTVVARGSGGECAWFAADAAAETMRVTSAGRWRVGTRLNLERALKVGDELGGHIVAGHVDGLVLVTAREDETGMATFRFRVPRTLARFIAVKGSVALDGVSLTVNEVQDDAFSVMIIPHTLAATTFQSLAAGDELNLEVDLMARYVARLLERA
jgi:riboflavin synthase